MAPGDVADVLEEAGHGWDETAGGDDRLDQHPGDPITVLDEHAVHVVWVVPPDLEGEGTHRIRDAQPGSHCVVVAVVGALRLDDEVAAGVSPHQVDRIHRCLGPRAAEPPERQPEPSRELGGDLGDLGGGLGKVRPSDEPFLHGGDNLGVGVTHHQRPVPVVEIEVVVAVQVGQP